MTTDGQPAEHMVLNKRTAIEDRRLQCSDLLMRGMTYRQIAAALGCSVGTVHNDVEVLRRSWRERASQTYSDMVAAEVAKLDRLEGAFMDKAMGGDSEALHGLLRLSARRAKLLGLDQPTRTDTVVTVKATTPMDEEIERLLAEFTGAAEPAEP